MEAMLLEDQVCTSIQGRRLVELGIKMPATFSHMPAKSGDHGEYVAYGKFGHSICPAWNVAELGVLLDGKYAGRISLVEGQYALIKRYHPIMFGGYYPTEAQARADLLIYLLEENIITI
jgi:hypothetical protein